MADLGLPLIKAEGKAFSYKEPGLIWDGLKKEFGRYFLGKYSAWYYWPVRWLILRVAGDAWDQALYDNAKWTVYKRRLCMGLLGKNIQRKK